MPTFEITLTQSDGRFAVWSKAELGEACRIGDRNLHPIFTKVIATSGTASRNFTMWFDDPKRSYKIGDSKTGSSVTNNDTITPTPPFASTPTFGPHQITVSHATDLTPLIIPIEMAVFKQLVIDLGPDDFILLLTFFYTLGPGPMWAPSDFLEKMADVRVMDQWDSDDPLQGPSKMGQIGIMGDRVPGV